MRTICVKGVRAALFVSACLSFAVPAVAQSVEWDVSLWGQRRAFTEHVEHLARYVERATGGEFVLNLSYGELSPNRENLDGIQAGRFEMAQFCAGYHPEKNRAITALELPFLGVRTLGEELAASRALYAHEAVVAEMAGWNAHLLMPTPLPQYNLVGGGTPPQDLNWLEGRAVRATGGIARALGQFGAETLSLTATETYDALEGATLDAVAFAQHAHFSFDTISLARWWTTNLDPGSVNCPVVVNIDALDALSDAHRAALDVGVERALDHYLRNYEDLILKWSEVLEVFGITPVTFSDEELANLRAGSADLHAIWAEEVTQAGLPADELVATITAALEAHRQSVD
ncbi:C4-dicarboxylate ABC transporter substrate-binding protein [Pontivivens insulae]|uniref:Solute-binding protein n=1 Tax=Pontivivens insulae TaxID=1639689 RepID=A0A2R8ACK8_9RHOB|nr:C4-dicarboxylate ABC transporter substrate-binding protein [Pontivivens insulae]RED13897.1 TRAP-type mannitol/chloroaromatic compound transport system substrate-binding protein [Pontivivens insulae]SPF29971.1 Solute-binding protein [Pontivivens insulae]